MDCHSEFESYFEGWSAQLTDFADANWKAGRVTRPLAHLCTFHEGRNELTAVPGKDIWSEQFTLAILKHREVIKRNNGIKEKNICALLAPVGFDVRKIDTVLIGDLSALGATRGGNAHLRRIWRAGIGRGFRRRLGRGFVTSRPDLSEQVLSLAKTCSMGLRSGEYLGRNTRRAPTSRIALRTAFPLRDRRLSRMTTSPGLRVGTRNRSRPPHLPDDIH